MSKIYKVGDEAELGPPLMSRFISEVVAQGGKVSLKGNKAVVIEAPNYVEPVPKAKAEPRPVQAIEEAPKKAPTRKKATSTPPED